MELLAVEDNWAVLAAEEELAVSGGSLTVNAWALGGLGQDLASLDRCWMVWRSSSVPLVMTTEPSLSGTATP